MWNSFISEIIVPSCRRQGYKNIRCASSSCSTKRTVSTPQMNELRPSPKLDLIGGNPVPKNAIGQPTHFTHPHLILEGEIVPGIRRDEFRDRRSRLVQSIELLSSKSNLKRKSHVIIIPSSLKKYMTEAIPYFFRQNSDFLYLTGCKEPDSILVITCLGEGNYESAIFLRGKDPQSELWDGARTGIDQGAEFFGVEKSLPLGEFEAFISSFIKDHSECKLWFDFVNVVHPNVHKWMKEYLTLISNKVWESPKPLIHRLRLYKSPAEQELMQKSCELGSHAIKATIKNSKAGDSEAQIFARVDYSCRMNGAEYLAYPPVVAGGNRANIIHYINNDQIVEDGEMVLMDAGCEFHGYTSDITRTWPISGKFSPAQRILYEVVYSVQMDLIQMCRQYPSLDNLFHTMCKLLGHRLQEAGVISTKIPDQDLSKLASIFCPHHSSHYLGMDVHDTSSVPRSIPVEPGMVFTIEPGVYVNFDNKFANPEFHGNGIRIEDDILMTTKGAVVLTASCPKDPDDLEKLTKN